MTKDTYDYDLFVIGAGSGGVRASRIAASLGAKVAIAEEYRVGGTCVIRGCIPKKLMTYAGHFRKDLEDAADYGWKVDGAAFDWPTFMQKKNAEISRLEGLYKKTLDGAGVTLFEGRASLKDTHTIVVGGKEITAGKILIATGGQPFLPDTPGIELAGSSNEFLELSRQPQKAVVVGGGYIAVEFAGILNNLGTETHLVYRKDLILRGFEKDMRQHLQDQMQHDGVIFHLNAVISYIEKKKSGKIVHLNNGETIVADEIIFAVGRRPNTEGLGLSVIGVEMDASGAIKVDEYSRTSVANIFAVGDVTDRVNLTPVAIKEGHAFALSEFGDEKVIPDHATVASAIFSDPPIGTVGLSEEDAREKYKDVKVFTSGFRPLKYTLTERHERSLIKLIVNGKNDKILGAHMIGLDAPEIIQGIAVAVKNGLTKAQLDATLAIHPTSAEEFVLLR